MSGVEIQVMNVLMLLVGGGVDLEINQSINPMAKQRSPMNHNDIGSMHFMLRVTGIKQVIEKVELMTPMVESKSLAGFKYAYFRGPRRDDE